MSRLEWSSTCFCQLPKSSPSTSTVPSIVEESSMESDNAAAGQEKSSQETSESCTVAPLSFTVHGLGAQQSVNEFDEYGRAVGSPESRVKKQTALMHQAAGASGMNPIPP